MADTTTIPAEAEALTTGDATQTHTEVDHGAAAAYRSEVAVIPVLER